jgi:hypothetical protein
MCQDNAWGGDPDDDIRIATSKETVDAANAAAFPTDGLAFLADRALAGAVVRDVSLQLAIAAAKRSVAVLTGSAVNAPARGAVVLL